MVEQTQRLTGLFAARFGALPAAIWRAPGRVNLIGEHTDYNGGLVLPVALDLACFAAAAPNGEGVLRVRAHDLGQEAEWPLEAIAGMRPERRWSDYVLGVAQALGREIPALDILVSSTVPIGGGLSSSAALEVAVAVALLDGRACEPPELARLCHRAETDFVGLPCGFMDQFVSVFGREGSALRIDCADESMRDVALPDGLLFVAVDSGVKHELASSAYSERVAECREAVRILGVDRLRDIPVEAWRGLFGAPLKRARHVVSENGRVENFIDACAAGDAVAMGREMTASHESLARDYQVSCAELDFLAASAVRVPGVHGARMTGGGFGGCTVNLMRPEAEEEFRERLSRGYRENFAREPKFHRCSPAAGAGRIACVAG